jgi:carbonic anhydrase
MRRLPLLATIRLAVYIQNDASPFTFALLLLPHRQLGEAANAARRAFKFRRPRYPQLPGKAFPKRLHTYLGYKIGFSFANKRSTTMSVTEEVLQANQKYAATFDQGSLAMPPARKLAILACMDARLTVEQVLGLKTGDAHIIRNAGGIATEDALRSLIISHHLLGTQEFIVINHTDCGMLTFNDHDLLHKLEEKTGASTIAPVHFHAFKDLENNVRRQVARIKNHPYVHGIPVRGFVYDVKTGKLNEVKEEAARSAQQKA